MKDLFISFDHDRLDSILSMKKGPQAEALYLINLYQSDALQLAKDCRDNFQHFEDRASTEYWREVCTCITRLMSRH